MKRRSVGFYLKIYFKIIAQDIKSKMSYRFDFIVSTLGILLNSIIGFVSFWILFCNFPSVMGWTYYEMLFLYGFSLVAMTPMQCLFDNNWNLRYNIFSGDFIKYCFRPINIFFYYISEVFDLKGLGQFVFGIITLVYSWNKLGMQVNIIVVIQMVIYLCSASLFMISIMNTAAASSFWIMNSSFVLETVFTLKDYTRYPATIFNSIFRFLFTFVIPISFVAYYPSLVILQPGKAPVISWISPFIGVIFFYISYKIWMRGALKYNGTGS